MKYTILLFIFFLSNQRVSSQSIYDDPVSTKLPSAGNSFVSSKSASQLDLYTGRTNINIPICNLESNELSIPISLSYVAVAGIKVQDVASSTGLGWQLNAGGSISRVVRGLPDEDVNGYIGSNHAGQTVNLYSSQTPTTTVLTQLSTGQLDGEPDLFNIKTPFFSIQFVFDQNGAPVFEKNSGLKVTYNIIGNSWIVVDDKGIQYFFGSTANSIETTTSVLYSTSKTSTLTWYLDKIISYNSKDQITFNYLSGLNYTISHYCSSQTSFSTSPSCSVTNIAPANYVINTTFNSPKYISSIISKIGEIDFNYLTDRTDVLNSNRLSSIKVKSLNSTLNSLTNELRTYNFITSYFGAPSSNYEQLRLKLDKIQLVGNSPLTSRPTTQFSFDYNLTTNLPPRNSTEFDYFGYYNVNPTGTALVPTAIKTPDLTRTKANMLTSIHDVLGGVETFEYELNDFFDGTVNTVVGGLRTSKISNFLQDGTSLGKQYYYKTNDLTGHSSGQISNQFYKNFNKVTNVLVTTTCGVSGTTTSSESTFNFSDMDGPVIGYSTVKIVNRNGSYEYNNFTNFSTYPDLYAGNNVNNAIYRQQSCATSLNYKRGLLLSHIEYKADGKLFKETDNTYTKLNITGTNSYSIRAIPYTYYQGGIVAFSFGTYTHNTENFVLTQTVSKDYNQDDITKFVTSTTNFSYCPNSRLIKSATNYDSKGNLFTRTYYHADDSSIPLVVASEQTAITKMLTGNLSNVLIHEKSVKNSAIEEVHYTYNTMGPVNNNYLSGISTYKNSPQVLTKQVFYNYEPVTSNLVSSNVSFGKSSSLQYGYHDALPVVKILNASLLYSVNSTFNSQYATCNLNNSATFTNAAIGNITFAVGFGSYPGATNLTQLHYSITGPSSYVGDLCYAQSGTGCFSVPSSITMINVPAGTYVISVTGSTNTVSSNPNIYFTYLNTTPITATTKEFFYEGFEQNYSGALTGSAHTGNSYYDASPVPFNINFTLPNTRGYTMQFWKLVGGIWVFNEQIYTGPTSITGIIDDIRIFPADAQMTTFTHNPLIGMSSQTDANGRSIYYEYDGLGRLMVVRDQDKNIISQYDYQYQAYSHALPVWQSTGNLRCKACALNTAYSSGMQQHEEKDVNPESTTYTTTRWIDDNIAGACVSLPDWQNTINASCQKNANNLNTGYQLQEQKDLNPCSATYNTLRTLTIYNTTACPIGAIITGQTSFSCASSTTGSGTIKALAGYLTSVTINSNGSSGTYTLSMTISGGVSMSQSTTNSSATFSFVMPASGTVNWSSTLSCTNVNGGGGITVH